jgi:hypothetical protein
MVAIDYTSSFGQPILSADQRYHPEDPGNAPWRLLSALVCCEGGWRGPSPAMGSQLPNTRSRGCVAQLPAVYCAIKRQGEGCDWFVEVVTDVFAG